MKSLSLALFAPLLFAAHCFAQPGFTKTEVDDMCGNFDYSRPLGHDSSGFDGFSLHLVCTWSAFRSDGKYYMFNFDYAHEFIKDGLVIADKQGNFVKYLPVYGSFDHGSNYLRTSNFLYDVEKDSIFPRPNIPPDTICMYGGGINFRLNEYEHVILSSAFGHLDSIRGFSICNRLTSEREFYRVPSMDEIESIFNDNISFDNERIIGDFRYGTPERTRWDSMCVLGMLNIKTREYRDILPSQRFGAFYYPNWTPWGTILISYACRDDTARQIWEIDTNGVFLRRLSDISMIFPTTYMEETPQSSFFSLSQNYPNPLRGEEPTTIPFDLPHGGDAVLTVYDIHGRVVERREVTGMQPGGHTAAIDMAGRPAGLYMYTLSSGGAVQARKMVVVR